MGYTSLIDIIGSMVIGGLLFVILLQMNDAATENVFTYNGELQVQQNLVSVVKMIEADFRKIGFCSNPMAVSPPMSIISADSESISFYTDLATSANHRGNGIVDRLRYYLGPASELSGTPNELDRMLYRVENNDPPTGANLGITEFKLKYYDSFGDLLESPVANTGEIQTIEINIRVENTAAYKKKYAGQAHNEQYQSAFWRQIRLNARNLRNR